MKVKVARALKKRFRKGETSEYQSKSLLLLNQNLVLMFLSKGGVSGTETTKIQALPE